VQDKVLGGYFLQIAKIIPYWLTGIALGALLKTFQSHNISRILKKVSSLQTNFIPIVIAAVLGAVSPITLFGIIPLLYVFDIENNRKLEAIIVAFIPLPYLLVQTFLYLHLV